MTAPAERMKLMRQRRRARGLRELRLVVADARSRAVRRRVAKQVASLDADHEREALQWMKRSPSLTQMQRGDVVTVAAAGDYGKPRPAVIVQTDAFPESHASVVLCQLTTKLADAPDFRVTIEPKPENGLRFRSQVMTDKPVTVRRERIGEKIGRLADQDMARLGIALAFVLGLAD